MTMRNLIQHILEKYHPVAIFLHGSRASGYSREHSDWDFAILVRENVQTYREIIDGENIEVLPLLLPFIEKDANWNYWHALREGNVEILYDPQGLAEDLIKAVTQHYQEPLEISDDRLLSKKARYRADLSSMIDYQNEPKAFFRKLGGLYERALRFWFQILHKKNMPQVYLSLPEIERRDPEYFNLLSILAGNYSPAEKIAAGEETYARIFK